jgi:acyl-CoA synthetase (AMP-forming)/AMP-acid ligase II
VSSTPFPQTWLLTYRPSLYAGIQVFMQCLRNGGTLVLPGVGMSVGDLIRTMRRHDVRCASATPAYWRRLVTIGSRDELRSVRLEQITLGGEAADQALLDAMRSLFPSARIVHIYATSELGRCFSVKDGRAGFPAAFLRGATEEGIELRVEGGELLVRSANAGLSDEDRGATGIAWIRTGDLVEADGERFHFVGRRTELINVGGNKVHPLKVERVVLEVPGVAEVRIHARSSSLVGQMVACEFVASEGCQADAVKAAILAHCRDRLAPHERPRFVEAVEQVRLSQAGKKTRGA